MIEALCAVVEYVADVSGVQPTTSEYLLLPDAPDTELLVGLLDDVVGRLDAEERIPVDAEAEVVEGGVGVRLAMTELDAVRLMGPTPIGVSRHDLRIAPDPRGWACSVGLLLEGDR